jgi:hypothetical protein
MCTGENLRVSHLLPAVTPAQQAMMKPKAPKKLERIKPGTVEYIPLTKDLYVPHKDVLALPQEEVRFYCLVYTFPSRMV